MTVNNIQKNPLRRTKIVCTIGPGSSSPSVIEKLLKAGMDVARINFAHGVYEEQAECIEIIRKEAERIGKPVSIMQDLPGPKDRTGRVRGGGVILNEGDEFVLTIRQVLGDKHQVSVDWADLPKTVKLGDIIFLDDGNIKLETTNINTDDVKCKVVVGGRLSDHRGINVPGITRAVNTMTEEDWDHLNFGIKHDVDFIALSFIQDAEDILKIRRFLEEKNVSKMLIAKIERREALDKLDEILEVADGVMVARGDLGIEIPIQKVPMAQKAIVQKCNSLGKPVIVATQMLESMVDSPRPTRAEVTDVANAIFDGTDAVMLSEETAVGHYPVEAVDMMTQVALETERALPYEDILTAKGKNLKPETDDAISYSACQIAKQLNAAVIIAFTSSGSTARRVAKYRPEVSILAITPSEVTRRQLALSWGVYTAQVPSVKKIADLFAQGVAVARDLKLAHDGDLIVITGGVPIGVPGSTNLLKVERI
ncbi:pyruvate kinase [Chloroflexota bacterium]